MDDTTAADAGPITTFIHRWRGATGKEIANFQPFMRELCAVLGLPDAPPETCDPQKDAYVFERSVTFVHGDGSTSPGRIDFYRRGAFVCEGKRVKAGAQTKAFDDALLRARSQAEAYARALPADEGRPPFLLVVDVGHVIEVYAELTRTGATYTPFPDPRSHRIGLVDLARPEIQERLRAIWLDPLSLDPARASARVTRAIAAQLAALARSFETAGHAPKEVAAFLSRCLFTMFAEDVGLLPRQAFGDLLDRFRDRPDLLGRMLEELWAAMDRGDFSAALAADVLRFNGKLFKERHALPLTPDQVDLLRAAAKADWKQVEPAIFGTLLERALDPQERHALGAHYTPRAYVERLVLPTVVEPLRADWANVQAAALVLADEAAALEGRAREAKLEEARSAVRDFLHRLTHVRVLDPACGSGNFLYVTLEHLKRLEGEVLNQLEALGDTQGRLDLAGVSVDPHQLLGIEINPRAAQIAEMVLWIGYLQWHFRTRGNVNPPEPVLKDFRNIENRDAVLAYDRVELVTDEHGRPVTRWDGRTTKTHPVTGEAVPDERAQVPVERYVSPRKAEWPEADFVVGNPPFIGNKRMRIALGDGYVEALRTVWQTVPDTADLVMYWWDHAAELTREGRLRRFGLITTNSLRQTFNRQVTERHLVAKNPLSLRFVIPDHPWVDSADGAAVRIAMSVGAAEDAPGELASVEDEAPLAEGEVAVSLGRRRGEIHADLTVGAKVAAAQRLAANSGICFQGMNLVGKGFRLEPAELPALGYVVDALPAVIKPHRNARDMMQGGDDCYVIDLFELTAEEARAQHPALYQRLYDRVKPERDHNNRESRRRNWWLFGEPVGKLRIAWKGLTRVVLTPETAKHRVFEFQSLPFCPDHKLYAICSADALLPGVLSSAVHVTWALRAGGRLGVGNDPTWTNTTCFSTFPFPAATPDQQARIRDLAEQLDAHRKRQQAAYPDLTLTGMYNVLEKLKAGEPLTAKEKDIHQQGLVSVLKTVHDALDRAVLEAYGWSDLVPLMEIVNGNAVHDRAGNDPPARSVAGPGRSGILAATGGDAGGEVSNRAVNDAPTESVLRPGWSGVQAATPMTRDEAKRLLDETLLDRLVALNAERAAEEKRGLIRWLRPEFQNPQGAGPAAQTEIESTDEAGAVIAPVAAAGKQAWPKDLTEQIKAVASVLAEVRGPQTEDDLAARFAGRGRWRERLPKILDMLVALGRAHVHEGAYVARS
jgi:hypothetical protein